MKAKLTQAQIDTVSRLRLFHTQKAIAGYFGVSQQLVSLIINGRKVGVRT